MTGEQHQVLARPLCERGRPPASGTVPLSGRTGPVRYRTGSDRSAERPPLWEQRVAVSESAAPARARFPCPRPGHNILVSLSGNEAPAPAPVGGHVLRKLAGQTVTQRHSRRDGTE